MANFLARRWTRQPQVPVGIDRSGIGWGMKLAWNAATPQINLADGTTDVQNNVNGISRVVRHDGVHVELGGTGYTGTFDFRGHIPPLKQGHEFTLIVSCNFTSATQDFARIYSSIRGGVETQYGQYEVVYRVADGGWVFRTSALVTIGTYSFGSTDRTLFNGVTVFRVSGANDPVVHTNGILLPTTRVTEPGALIWDNGTQVLFGVSTVTARQPTGTCLYQHAWYRYLSDAEVAEVTANPWQIYAPRRDIIYSLPAATALPTLTLPGVQDVGPTSARPKVTRTFA